MNFLKQQLRKLGEVKFGLVLLGFGIVLGILFARLFKGFYWNNINIFDSNYIDKIKNSSIEYSVLLKYVYWNVFKPFVLFWIVCVTVLGIPFIGGCLLYMGFQGGFFVSVILMKYGIKGILLLLGYTFPHYLVYIPVALLCFRSGYWFCRSLRYDNLGRKGKTDKILKYIILILFFSFLLLVGGFLETYVNTFILKKILYFF